jgi:hypothetical protein
MSGKIKDKDWNELIGAIQDYLTEVDPLAAVRRQLAVLKSGVMNDSEMLMGVFAVIVVMGCNPTIRKDIVRITFDAWGTRMRKAVEERKEGTDLFRGDPGFGRFREDN